MKYEKKATNIVTERQDRERMMDDRFSKQSITYKPKRKQPFGKLKKILCDLAERKRNLTLVSTLIYIVFVYMLK